MSQPRILLHCGPQPTLCGQLLDAIEKINPEATIKRDWDSVTRDMEKRAMNSVDVVIDALGEDGRIGLEHLQEVRKLRVLYNHSAIPLYFALSCSDQPAALRYEIRRLGGFFMHMSDVPRHFSPQIEEIRLQLAEVQRSVPRWEIIEEHSGSDPVRAYVFFKFASKLIQVGGSDRHLAVLGVLLKNNGIARSMTALRQLCGEDSLFAESGGPLTVPQRGTMKMYLYRDYPKHLQRVFDEAQSGFRAERVIEHVDLGAKAMGFRIRGRSEVTVR